MKRKRNTSLKYVVIVLAIIAFSLAIYYFFKVQYFGADYLRAIESENPSDKCSTPDGYTRESWREHMSHHPDRYRECLE